MSEFRKIKIPKGRHCGECVFLGMYVMCGLFRIRITYNARDVKCLKKYPNGMVFIEKEQK